MIVSRSYRTRLTPLDVYLSYSSIIGGLKGNKELNLSNTDNIGLNEVLKLATMYPL